MSKYVLKLYVTDRTPRSEQAIMNLRRICQEKLDDNYEIVVIDVLERPQNAEDDRIVATPTLIRHSPAPIRRVVGDLSDLDRVIEGLGLNLVWDLEEIPGGEP